MVGDTDRPDPRLRLYVGIIWIDDNTPGQRVRYYASGPEDAAAQLRTDFGTDCVYTIHNPANVGAARDSN